MLLVNRTHSHTNKIHPPFQSLSMNEKLTFRWVLWQEWCFAPSWWASIQIEVVGTVFTVLAAWPFLNMTHFYRCCVCFFFFLTVTDLEVCKFVFSQCSTAHSSLQGNINTLQGLRSYLLMNFGGFVESVVVEPIQQKRLRVPQGSW